MLLKIDLYYIHNACIQQIRLKLTEFPVKMRYAPTELLSQRNPAFHPAQNVRINRRMAQIALIVKTAFSLPDGEIFCPSAAENAQSCKVNLHEKSIWGLDAFAGHVCHFVWTMEEYLQEIS